MDRHRVPLVLAVLAVVAGACAAGGGQVADDPTPVPPRTSTASPPADTPSPGSPPVTSVDARFDFRAPEVDGGTFDASSLSGRDVAIWFWAPW